ncbi:MAG: AAA family ATPase, partial [Oscillospiraceae bacterium]|nr:AAA family ATPase [Oscillospiraceae bacterium]
MNYESKVTGTVDNITYYNAQNGFTVLDLDVSGELLTCVGPIPDVSKGEELVLTGRYDNHSTYGRQFRVEFYERHLPETAAQLLKYLSSRTIKGIGQRTAVKIIERFGERTFDILEKEPERLTEIKGFTLEKARAVSNEFNKQFAVRTIMISLERYGIKPYECIAIYKRFGINAAAVVTENPYILCASIEGISFDRAEEIAGKLPCKPADTYRIKAGIAHILRHNLYNGHTCVPKDKLPPLCKDLLGINAEETEACLSEMTGSKMIISENLEEREFLFLPHIYSAEKNIAERLKLFLKFPPASMPTLEKDIEEIEEINKIKYERLQREAIMTAAEKGMLILTGGPGTGKTTTVRGIISLFEKSKIRILMAAPTGRAAKRMNELTGRDAKTIHRLLEVEWDANDKQRFKRNVANPLECGAIIIDELSMVDVELFSSLLDALPIGCRIIMLGDYDQLPPVGAG